MRDALGSGRSVVLRALSSIVLCGLRWNQRGTNAQVNMESMWYRCETDMESIGTQYASRYEIKMESMWKSTWNRYEILMELIQTQYVANLDSQPGVSI